MSDCYGWSCLADERPRELANVLLAFRKKSGGWHYKVINNWQFAHNLHYKERAFEIYWQNIGHGPFEGRLKDADEQKNA